MQKKFEQLPGLSNVSGKYTKRSPIETYGNLRMNLTATPDPIYTADHTSQDQPIPSEFVVQGQQRNINNVSSPSWPTALSTALRDYNPQTRNVFKQRTGGNLIKSSTSTFATKHNGGDSAYQNQVQQLRDRTGSTSSSSYVSTPKSIRTPIRPGMRGSHSNYAVDTSHVTAADIGLHLQPKHTSSIERRHATRKKQMPDNPLSFYNNANADAFHNPNRSFDCQGEAPYVNYPLAKQPVGVNPSDYSLHSSQPIGGIRHSMSHSADSNFDGPLSNRYRRNLWESARAIVDNDPSTINGSYNQPTDEQEAWRPMPGLHYTLRALQEYLPDLVDELSLGSPICSPTPQYPDELQHRHTVIDDGESSTAMSPPPTGSGNSTTLQHLLCLKARIERVIAQSTQEMGTTRGDINVASNQRIGGANAATPTSIKPGRGRSLSFTLNRQQHPSAPPPTAMIPVPPSSSSNQSSSGNKCKGMLDQFSQDELMHLLNAVKDLLTIQTGSAGAGVSPSNLNTPEDSTKLLSQPGDVDHRSLTAGDDSGIAPDLSAIHNSPPPDATPVAAAMHKRLPVGFQHFKRYLDDKFGPDRWIAASSQSNKPPTDSATGRRNRIIPTGGDSKRPSYLASGDLVSSSRIEEEAGQRLATTPVAFDGNRSATPSVVRLSQPHRPQDNIITPPAVITRPGQSSYNHHRLPPHHHQLQSPSQRNDAYLGQDLAITMQHQQHHQQPENELSADNSSNTPYVLNSHHWSHINDAIDLAPSPPPTATATHNYYYNYYHRNPVPHQGPPRSLILEGSHRESYQNDDDDEEHVAGPHHVYYYHPPPPPGSQQRYYSQQQYQQQQLTNFNYPTIDWSSSTGGGIGRQGDGSANLYQHYYQTWDHNYAPNLYTDQYWHGPTSNISPTNRSVEFFPPHESTSQPLAGFIGYPHPNHPVIVGWSPYQPMTIHSRASTNQQREHPIAHRLTGKTTDCRYQPNRQRPPPGRPYTARNASLNTFESPHPSNYAPRMSRSGSYGAGFSFGWPSSQRGWPMTNSISANDLVGLSTNAGDSSEIASPPPQPPPRRYNNRSHPHQHPTPTSSRQPPSRPLVIHSASRIDGNRESTHKLELFGSLPADWDQLAPEIHESFKFLIELDSCKSSQVQLPRGWTRRLYANSFYYYQRSQQPSRRRSTTSTLVSTNPILAPNLPLAWDRVESDQYGVYYQHLLMPKSQRHHPYFWTPGYFKNPGIELEDFFTDLRGLQLALFYHQPGDYHEIEAFKDSDTPSSHSHFVDFVKTLDLNTLTHNLTALDLSFYNELETLLNYVEQCQLQISFQMFLRQPPTGVFLSEQSTPLYPS